MLVELHRPLHFWLLTAAAVLLLLGPIRKGDLAGYDDAVYAHIAKGIVTSGDWIRIQSNGYPVLEHPPGFVWMQAAVLSILGPLTENWDFLAKLPSALPGVGVVLLVYWLALRLGGDRVVALAAMFIMLGTPYFIKYTSHAMTDVPFTFLFTAVVCCWVAGLGIRRSASEERRAEQEDAGGSTRSGLLWAGAALAAYAMLMRGVVGLAVPLTLAIVWFFSGDRARSAVHAIPALVLSFVPITAWYGSQIEIYGDQFWIVQTAFLTDKIGGDVAGSWRQYTGAFEYLWMLAQSYWPWLPFTAWGGWIVSRRGGNVRLVLLPWIAVMFLACALGGSRVLRYLLPAYPAFSILAAIGIVDLIPLARVEKGLRWAIPAGLVVAAGIALFPPVTLHAEIVRPIAEAASTVAAPEERIGFWDQGQPRFDETGQMQWYGDRTLWILTDPQQFEEALAEPWSTVWVIDEGTYQERFAPRPDATVVARSGHLVCVKLAVRRR